MHFLYPTFLYCIIILFTGSSALESPTASTSKSVEPVATNIMLQSKDGGQTWQDISEGLPENDQSEDEQPLDFIAGESAVYVHVNNTVFRSNNNLKTPVWEKENGVVANGKSVVFTRSGVIAFGYGGKFYQKMTSKGGTWRPVYTNFNNQKVRTIFETSAGTLFVGCDDGLYKSDDKGQSWRNVLDEGYVVVTDLVESDGVLIGAGRNGILRSADNGEHWEWVINEGGVGKFVERIAGGFAAISYDSKIMAAKMSVSMDKGKTWKTIDQGLHHSLSLLSTQPSLSLLSVRQMGNYLVCAHADGIFRSSDLGRTWNKVQAGVAEKVFRIYTSGNTLYAVLGGLGC